MQATWLSSILAIRAEAAAAAKPKNKEIQVIVRVAEDDPYAEEPLPHWAHLLLEYGDPED